VDLNISKAIFLKHFLEHFFYRIIYLFFVALNSKTAFSNTINLAQKSFMINTFVYHIGLNNQKELFFLRKFK
jgi:hypothetical protein